MRHVDIVVPVYDGYEETVACLSSVLETTDSAWARLVIINDYSPDPKITEYLRELAGARADVVLLENSENLGFVATANRGMDYDHERDVLLLNSDVEVVGNWLTRLREAAYHHEKVASVTPFSNNATLCSFPNICEDNRPVFGLSLAEIDAQFAAEFNVGDAYQVPTGVGCCMYLLRDCLNQVGFFDLETFGRGYGEENDWCQRAAREGRRNLHLANCFVYHWGGVSFGEEYNSRITKAMQILDRKYPRYHADVQRFIARDPARVSRVRAWLRLFASQQKPKILMISHKLGGGAQQHVDELARMYDGRALFLLMIPDRDGETVRLSCFDGDRRLKDGLIFDIAHEYDRLLELLRGLGMSRVHFHHTMGLHTRLWGLASDLGCSYDLTIHDYYLVNGNPTLTNKEARYVREELSDFDEQCAGHRPLPDGVDGERWRTNQKLIVEAADRVIFPSVDTANRFKKFFNVESPVIAWHTDYAESSPYPEPYWQFPEKRPLRVLVLGALSREKGADVLEAVAGALSGASIEFHLLGYAYRRLAHSVISHGPYDNKDIDKLVAEVRPDVVWFPALWPETYSYTLSVALHNGLPIVVPNIGAFVERVRSRAHTAVVDWQKTTTEWREFWIGVLESGELRGDSAQFVADDADILRDFYRDEYLKQDVAFPEPMATDFLLSLSPNLYYDTLELSKSEWVLNRIWLFSRRPLIARLISIVPFRVQQSIKRFLSHRPMHDIVSK